MVKLPATIIRMDDGQEFILDESKGTYSLKLCQKWKAAGHLIWEYTYDQLMGNNDGKFKIADGTEDIEAMQKAWMKRMKALSHD